MNYKLEGDSNFNDLLMEAICDEKDENDNITCLISNVPLEEYHIKLDCNHSFNYTPLFKEIVRQKKNINHLEVQRLKAHQIKCPYCRNVQNSLLPYNDKLGKRVYGVNWPSKWAMKSNRCSAIFKSGKRKNEPCNRACFGKYCKTHKKYSSIKHLICSVILKSGKRKGSACGCKVKHNGFCGRHQPKNNLVNV